MYIMKELPIVEETKHLVPNLEVLSEALFGENAYLLPKMPRQADWATDKTKIGDGLLWLPWSRQLWLIEVEWKEGSNFFNQSRAFAEGKVDESRLSKDLESALEKFMELLSQSKFSVKEEIVLEGIIKRTLEIHVSGGKLRPHGWVILGHSGNREKLRKDYEKELQARFTGDQHYILSMARMFQGDFSSYILLEQHCSKGCQDILSVVSSVLVPAVVATQETIVEGPIVEPEKIPKAGRAVRFWNSLKTIYPELMPDNVRLQIYIDEKNSADFKVDWDHKGKELMVLSEEGFHQKPANAFKAVFGKSVVSEYGNIARRFGKFIDISKSPLVVIAAYKDIEHAAWKQDEILNTSKLTISGQPQQSETYFDSRTANKQKKIHDNILNRSKLWEIFLEKGKMTTAEFKKNSEYKAKAIAGFMIWLTKNGIATRSGDLFTLNEAVTPHIKKILAEK